MRCQHWVQAVAPLGAAAGCREQGSVSVRKGFLGSDCEAQGLNPEDALGTPQSGDFQGASSASPVGPANPDFL